MHARVYHVCMLGRAVLQRARHTRTPHAPSLPWPPACNSLQLPATAWAWAQEAEAEQQLEGAAYLNMHAGQMQLTQQGIQVGGVGWECLCVCAWGGGSSMGAFARSLAHAQCPPHCQLDTHASMLSPLQRRRRWRALQHSGLQPCARPSRPQPCGSRNVPPARLPPGGGRPPAKRRHMRGR